MIRRHHEGERLRQGVNVGNNYVILRLWRWWFGYDRSVKAFVHSTWKGAGR